MTLHETQGFEYASWAGLKSKAANAADQEGTT